MKLAFSISRLWAIMLKEFILMKRDPAVIAIMAVLPLILVCFAGYAINIFPKQVPTVLMDLDDSVFTRKFIQGMENTGFFKFTTTTKNSAEAYHFVKTDKALFVLTIPPHFTHDLLLRKYPSILLEDGSLDALSTGRAVIAFLGLKQYFSENFESGALQNLQSSPSVLHAIVNRIYDPDHVTQFYVVPGMIGIILMLTMLMITTVIAFRDVQGGTIEYLLASPARPLEILLGEILSYIIIGYIQLTLGLLLAHYLFHIPFLGSPGLLYLCALPYIITELSLGLTIATLCATQFEAVQVINLFISLSVILTGFVFPIFGMPEWAQYASLFVPLTHFFKILFGIMLRGNIFSEVWPHLWPLLLYSLIMITLAAVRFGRRFR